MTEKNRLVELAIKGLEAEKLRIDQELADLRKQLGGGYRGTARAAATREKGSHISAAGRKKLSDLMRKRWAERRKAAAKAAK